MVRDVLSRRTGGRRRHRHPYAGCPHQRTRIGPVGPISAPWADAARSATGKSADRAAGVHLADKAVPVVDDVDVALAIHGGWRVVELGLCPGDAAAVVTVDAGASDGGVVLLAIIAPCNSS